MLRKFRYGLEGAFLLLAVLLFRLLPLDLASALGGMLSRLAGPFVRVHRTARSNLEHALPELDDYQRSRILKGMWDNLGRVIGEYPHLSRKIMARRITIEGREHIDRIKASGKAAIFVSGHFANWEVIPLAASLYGMPMVVIYRAANNPVAEWLIRRIRAPFTRDMHTKGVGAAVRSVKALKEGRPLAMLVDQKMNDGHSVPFFGRPAMTATAAVQLAIKYQLPLLVARCVRTDGVHFQVTVEPPILYPPDADPVKAMADIHMVFERWIREHPSQWFWVHRRWEK